MKTKRIEYTCTCGHKWARNIRVYEGALWPEADKQERLCTPCDKLRSARVHSAMAVHLRAQAYDIFNRRKARKALT